MSLGITPIASCRKKIFYRMDYIMWQWRRCVAINYHYSHAIIFFLSNLVQYIGISYFFTGCRWCIRHIKYLILSWFENMLLFFCFLLIFKEHKTWLLSKFERIKLYKILHILFFSLFLGISGQKRKGILIFLRLVIPTIVLIWAYVPLPSNKEVIKKAFVWIHRSS